MHLKGLSGQWLGKRNVGRDCDVPMDATFEKWGLLRKK